MKRRYLLAMIIVLSLLFALTNCTNKNINNNSNQKEPETNMANSSVYIDGKKASNLSAFVDSTNVKLPFVKTVKALGMVVEIVSDKIVYITYNKDIFILHLYPDITLVNQSDEDDNLMLPPPGASSYHCKYESNDVILDSITLSGVLYRMGISAYISVDNTNKQVNIITSLENN